MPTFQLIIRRGPRAGDTYPLTMETIIVGRDATADISINDPEVSRNHCRLILEDVYYIQDLGSTNGTFVDGKRLGGEPIELMHGQIIQLGSNVSLLFHEVGAPITAIKGAETPPAAVDPDEEESAGREFIPFDEPPAPKADISAAQPTPRPAAGAGSVPRRPDQAPDDLREEALEAMAKDIRRRYLIAGMAIAAVVLCLACAALAGLVFYLRNEGLLLIFQAAPGLLALPL